MQDKEDASSEALTRLNDEGCALYRRGDHSGSLTFFLEGLRRHKQTSKYFPAISLVQGGNVKRQSKREDNDAASRSAATCEDQDIEFDEGMYVFTDVLSLSTSSRGCPLPDSLVILATLLFNAGQAKRRADAIDEASNLYAAAHRVISTSHDDKNEKLSLFCVMTATSSFSPPSAQPITVPIQHNIGQLQYRSGKIRGAIGSFSEALIGARSIHGEKNAAAATILNSLGVIYYHCFSAESNEALFFFEDALKIQVEVLGRNAHPDAATTLNNIGRAHAQRGNFDEALLCYEQALVIRGDKLGGDSLDYAATALNAGQILHQKGDYDKALKLYHKFLRILTEKFSKNQRNVAEVLSSIAEIHIKKGDFDKANEFYEESLAAMKGALGEFHSEVSLLYTRIGNFHFSQGNLQAALKSFSDGLRVERRFLGPDHPNIITSLTIIGEIQRQRNELDEAAKHYCEVLELQRSKYLVDHEDIVSTLSVLGVIYEKKGDTRRSIQYAYDAQQMKRRLLGEAGEVVADVETCGQDKAIPPNNRTDPNLSSRESRSKERKDIAAHDKSVPIKCNGDISIDSSCVNEQDEDNDSIEAPATKERLIMKRRLSSAGSDMDLNSETKNIIPEYENMVIGDKDDDTIGSTTKTAQEIESVAMETFINEKSIYGSLGSFTFMTESIAKESDSTVIYESLSTRIWRVHDSQNILGGSSEFVAVKMLTDQFPNPNLISSLENEYKISQHLSECDVTRSTFKEQKHDGSYALYLEWVEGITLKEWIRSAHKKENQTYKTDGNFVCAKEKNSLDYRSVVLLAKEIAVAVEKIHCFGIAHNSLTAENIIVDTSNDDCSFSIKIIDFGLAAQIDKDANDLGYKQNDLIALGALFLELFLGEALLQGTSVGSIEEYGNKKQPHFSKQHGSCNEEKPKHNDIISRLRSNVPSCIACLVFDLIQKKGESYRYQSASDVATDLSKILTEYSDLLCNIDKEHGTGPFNFQTDKIYGRNEEIYVIIDAYKRIVQPERSSEIVIVSGYSGAGKSALVQQVQQPIKDMGGNFLSGKYDRFRQMEPLSAIIVAFTDYCEAVAKISGQVQELRDRIKTIVGSEITILASVLPSLHKIIELPSTVASQGALKKASHRIKIAFRLFVKAISTFNKPLVLFLDDIQWADPLSLDLIESLTTDKENKSILIIGSYRNNEVDEQDQLAVQLRSIEGKQVPINWIKLGNLKKEDVNALISDVIQTPPYLTQPLTNAVYRKTSGNVLFVLEFLRSIYDEGLLYFSVQLNQWQWDASIIESKTTGTSVVELMLHKIKNFPPNVQNAIKLLSCLGTDCEQSIITLIGSCDSIQQFGCSDLMSSLKFSIDEGLLDYSGTNYKFAHDQIQRAAYSLIPENDRGKFHLWIGSQVWANEATIPEKALFIAVGQMNKGAVLIADEHHLVQLIELNLKAGKKSMSLGAFEPAAFYLKKGISVLGNNYWEEHYDLCLQLLGLYAEAKYCVGEFEEMDKILEEIFANAICFDDKLGAYYTLVSALHAQGKHQKILTIGLDILSSLGKPVPTDSDMKAAVMIEIEITKQMLEGKTDAQILALKRMDDSHKISAMRLLYGLSSSFFYTRQDMSLFLALQMVQTSLRDGICNESAFAFSSFGVVFLTITDVMFNINFASRMGKLSLSLLEMSQAKEYLPSIYFSVYVYVRPWIDHYRASIEPLKHAYSVGMRCGELNYASNAAKQICMISFHCGEELKIVEERIQYYGDKMNEHKLDHYWKMILPCRQAIYKLMGHSSNSEELVMDYVDEEKLLKDARKNNNIVVSVTYYLRAWVAYILRDNELASKMVEERRQSLEKQRNLPFLQPFVTFVEGLVSLETCHRVDDLKWKVIAEESICEMKTYANHAPSNHMQKLLILQAESAFLAAQYDDAAKLYDAAISTAGDNGFIQDQAVAYERAGIFHFERGNNSMASCYYGQAHDAYLKWGAQKKANELRIHCPF